MSTQTQPIPDAPAGPLPLPGRPRRAFPWVRLVFVLLGLLCLPALLTSSEGARGLMALAFAGILFFLVKRAPGVGVGATIGYLCLLGGLRRWLIPVYNWSGTDPLLLTGPIVVALLLLSTRRTTLPTRLSRMLVCLIVFMVVEVVNPQQGGLVVGLSGVLFYIVPLLWYFAARQFAGSGVILTLARAVIGIAVVAALYGFYQTYFGFNAAELEWMRTVKTAYAALGVGGRTRPFSFFTSASEYARFLGFGLVLVWAFWLRGSRALIVLLPLFAVAMFLESVRSAIVIALVTCVTLWAIQAKDPRAWLTRGVPMLVLVAALSYFGLRNLSTSGMSESTQGLAEHTVSGLTDPTHSTAVGHSTQIVYAVLRSIQDPIGEGLGATTIAAAKFGGSGDSAENDVGNMFISLGFIGGLIYLGVVIRVAFLAFQLWHRTRSTAALIIVALLLFSSTQWLNGEEYATCVLSWISIGVLDRLSDTGAVARRSNATQ